MRTGKRRAPLELLWWLTPEEVTRILMSIGDAAGNARKGRASTLNGTCKLAFPLVNSAWAPATSKTWRAFPLTAEQNSSGAKEAVGIDENNWYSSSAADRDCAAPVSGRSARAFRLTSARANSKGASSVDTVRNSISPADGAA